MLMESEKECLECGARIAGRADKKFCSPQCRNDYNNKLRTDANNYMRRINNILRKNRRILAELNPGGKAKVSKEKLLSRGFDLNYFTNTYRTRSGSTYFFCYDQGYLPLDHDYYALVVKQEYVDA